jgi:hypothetical protein
MVKNLPMVVMRKSIKRKNGINGLNEVNGDPEGPHPMTRKAGDKLKYRKKTIREAHHLARLSIQNLLSRRRREIKEEPPPVSAVEQMCPKASRHIRHRI